MADLLRPGVWWLHQTRGSNVYLLDLPGGALALIDTGFGDSAAGIIREVERVAPGSRVTHILLTHAHFDHVGAARALRDHYGARVLVGWADCTIDAEGRLVISGRMGRSHRGGPLRRWWRSRRFGASQPVAVDLPLHADQEVLPGLLAVATPGHTPGSYCYVATRRDIAFVGDLVISHRDGLARALALANQDDAEYLRGLAAFAARTPDAGCAGHGPPVLEGFRAQMLTLAAQPRRRWVGPLGQWQRLRRLRDFYRYLARERRLPDDV